MSSNDEGEGAAVFRAGSGLGISEGRRHGTKGQKKDPQARGKAGPDALMGDGSVWIMVVESHT